MLQKNRIGSLNLNARCWVIILGLLFIHKIEAQTRSLTTILESLSEQYQVFFSYDADLLLLLG